MEHDYFEVEGKEVSSEEFFAYIEPFANGEQIEDMDYTEEMLDKVLLDGLSEEELSALKRVIPEEICDENNPNMADIPEGDEETEVVLTCAGENLILHAAEGTVYGYVFDFWGEMGEITKDGVFRMGKLNTQCGKMVSFKKNGCVTEPVENYEYMDDNRIRYYFFSGES